ncbi:cyclic nucleotide-binding-like protein [Chytridium lagenaria]|nr:cyclic nucleotide-binding-like protein [Chytridium lagenaria]
MAVHYLHSGEFKYDIIANLPLDIIALGWSGHPIETALSMLTFLRLGKVIRVARILTFFRRQERKLHATFMLQVLKFMTFLIVITHSLACIWYVLVCPDTDSGMCSMPTDIDKVGVLRNQSLLSLYVHDHYDDVGYGDIIPINDGQRIFAVFTMTSGIFFYGYVSGTIASALSNMDSRRVAYQQKMDAVRQYMGIDIKNLFEDMPSTFRSEVALSLNNAIIDKANIFRGCSIGFRRMIAIDMKLYLFTANEYVVHRGDLGLEMYFITQGRIDVYSTEDLRKPTASLIEGAHFGEFQIILGHRHEYSARAVCNTDIYVLHLRDVQRAFEAYPEDKDLVRNATEERYKQAMSTRKTRKVNTDDIEDDFVGVVVKPRRSSVALGGFNPNKPFMNHSSSDMSRSAAKEYEGLMAGGGDVAGFGSKNIRRSSRLDSSTSSEKIAQPTSSRNSGSIRNVSNSRLESNEVRIAVGDRDGQLSGQTSAAEAEAQRKNSRPSFVKQSSADVLAAEEGMNTAGPGKSPE